ncbi:MAG: hypothetical protein Q7U51_06170 [Methanoregula sp.]|nr:hypothetical protein [Methanoregula sp.]
MGEDIAIRVLGLGKKYVIGGAQEQYHTFGESGEYDELLEKFGLTTKNIVTSDREIVRRKK